MQPSHSLGTPPPPTPPSTSKPAKADDSRRGCKWESLGTFCGGLVIGVGLTLITTAVKCPPVPAPAGQPATPAPPPPVATPVTPPAPVPVDDTTTTTMSHDVRTGAVK